MVNRWRVDEIKAIYGDPQRMFARSGPKLGADLVVVAIATLNEVAQIREMLAELLGRPDRDAAVIQAVLDRTPPESKAGRR